jgi:5-oxoprolinase (ATP-hydrolysing)
VCVCVSLSLQGISLVLELIDAYGLDVVQAYMHHIQTNAEVAVRDMLREIGTKVLQRSGVSKLEAEDYLDDGSPIRLKISIDIQQGTAVCDFRFSIFVFLWCVWTLLCISFKHI